MSANNGLSIRKTDNQYELWEYDVDSGERYWTEYFPTLEDAMKYAQEYMKKEVVEYGLQAYTIY